MSDVAVTWAKAQVCPGKSGKPDRTAKQVLVHMASYADAVGEAWVLVGLLALEMDVEERTVERGRKALVAAGLLIKTGRTRLHNGKLVPIYQLPLDTGHASTARRIKAEREAWGDTGVAPSPAPGATRVSPQDVVNVAPRGDTGVAQIGKGITQELKLSAGACAKAQAMWAVKAPERVSPKRVEAAWAAAIDRAGVDDGAMLDAVARAVERDPDFGRGRAMNLDRWLGEDRFMAWLAEGGLGEGAGRVEGADGRPGDWGGPEAVRAVVAGAIGAGAMASYFNPARWDPDRQAVVTRTRYAADQLRREVGSRLDAIGVSIAAEARLGQGGAGKMREARHG